MKGFRAKKKAIEMDKSVDDAANTTTTREEVPSTNTGTKTIDDEEGGVEKQTSSDAPLVNVNVLSTVLETKEEDEDDDNNNNGKDVGRRDNKYKDDDEEGEDSYVPYRPKVVHDIKLSRFYDEMKSKRTEFAHINDEVVEYPIEASFEDTTEASGLRTTVERFSYHGFKVTSNRALDVPKKGSMLELLRMQGGVSSLIVGSTDDSVGGADLDDSVLMAYRHLAQYPPARSRIVYDGSSTDDDDDDDGDDFVGYTNDNNDDY